MGIESPVNIRRIESHGGKVKRHSAWSTGLAATTYKEVGADEDASEDVGITKSDQVLKSMSTPSVGRIAPKSKEPSDPCTICTGTLSKLQSGKMRKM
ncbi:hypothetical protein T265_03976 [Opisthorchis viverrini]|uniref:Uncharacterized protein n=1 Tax=Opisthorchis viverrini TaxID=6198 RepID=A0A074ZU87_OPIVI|nr:hypothetical protein T265_03976 [Opisthorchis viverrini]KER29407.1 hypothetical protein T265_03976 [Opisthorchis viverrini]